ncbi:MAG TPA: glycogen debranching protein GlgX [Spirochaetota bacterium]|nr:glycogen debranching protein GlgX [Spirochaetota bacterium]
MIQEYNKANLKTATGSPYYEGANLTNDGCNFTVFSKNATDIYLLLFKNNDDSEPEHILKFDHRENKTGDMWHIFVYGIKQGQLYGYCVDGPYWPEKKGHRFNVNKLLIDPYARAVTGEYKWIDLSSFGYDYYSPYKDLSFDKQKNWGNVPKSVVVNTNDFDWEGDKPLNIPLNETVIYEMHVRGFSYDKSSKVTKPGTYLGIVEKIPYLKELGITTVELLPVHEFNEFENTRINPITKEQLVNFTGYSTLAFFAPDVWYATKRDGITAVNEFKTMVKELHKAGIEIILDVVYNHTGEGNEAGPTISFKGFDNSIYYMLEKGRYYKNYSGCGNTLNCNHPVVKHLIKDSLRYWVVDMHVDGFRFDLAAIMGRDRNGKWIPDYSVLTEISEDPILSNTKIIAESWDAAGLYTVGRFPSGWAEWNGKFRDDVRSFIKGDEGKVGDIARRITGSADIFHYSERKPCHSINILTTHDGFTLNDLVSYNEKHNEQNGEDNKDGDNHNLSWNCGIEGETGDPEILNLRDRQMKNFLSILMLSQGTPMLYAGDEMKFSKKGNNNTYCHDNKLNWLDWSLLEKNRDFFEFIKFIIRFRKNHPVFRRERFFTGVDSAGNDLPDISWHGVEVHKPDWGFDSHAIAFMLDGSKADTGAEMDDNNVYVAINSYWEDLSFNLPEPGEKRMWHMAINTAEKPGFYKTGEEPRVYTPIIKLKSRSLVVLIDK